MKIKHQILAGTLLASIALPGAAAAEQAYATTDLNVRAGPGPRYPIVTVIPGEQGVTVHGCTDSLSWCDVTFDGERGWAYAQYLAYETAGKPTIVAEAKTEIPIVEFQMGIYWDQHYIHRPFYSERERYVVTDGSAGAATGAAGGAVAGAIIGGPAGAAIGGAAGLALGAAIDPPQRVRTYVVEQPAEPVLLEGEVVVGAKLPEVVTLHPVPDYEYDYAVVNGQRVLVDPNTRIIVHIYR